MREDFEINYPEDKIPNLRAELDYFAQHPQTPKLKLQLEDLVNLLYFDQDGVVVIDKSKNDEPLKVVIKREEEHFEIYENDVQLCSFLDQVTINRKEYYCSKMMEADRQVLEDQEVKNLTNQQHENEGTPPGLSSEDRLQPARLRYHLLGRLQRLRPGGQHLRIHHLDQPERHPC